MVTKMAPPAFCLTFLSSLSHPTAPLQLPHSYWWLLIFIVDTVPALFSSFVWSLVPFHRLSLSTLLGKHLPTAWIFPFPWQSVPRQTQFCLCHGWCCQPGWDSRWLWPAWSGQGFSRRAYSGKCSHFQEGLKKKKRLGFPVVRAGVSLVA